MDIFKQRHVKVIPNYLLPLPLFDCHKPICLIRVQIDKNHKNFQFHGQTSWFRLNLGHFHFFQPTQLNNCGVIELQTHSRAASRLCWQLWQVSKQKVANASHKCKTDAGVKIKRLTSQYRAFIQHFMPPRSFRSQNAFKMFAHKI